MRTKILSVILLIIIVWLQFQIWQIQKGQVRADSLNNVLDNISQLKLEIKEQRSQNEHLLTRNKELKKEIWLLRNDPQILEEKAREQLGLIKKDEIFYRIIPKENQ